MISAPSEMRCSEMPEILHERRRSTASTSGMAIATTSPARRPRLRKLTASTMTTASNSASREAADRLLDHGRLVGDEMHADADRQLAHDLAHCAAQRLAELEQVAVGLHADGEADRRLAVEAEQRLRRVGVAARDGGDVGQPEEAVVDAQVDGRAGSPRR